MRRIWGRCSLDCCARRRGRTEKTRARAAVEIRGRTVKALTTDRLALGAKRLLVPATSTVTASGETLGVEKRTYFVECFKRETRVTPAAFRRQHRRA